MDEDLFGITTSLPFAVPDFCYLFWLFDICCLSIFVVSLIQSTSRKLQAAACRKQRWLICAGTLSGSDLGTALCSTSRAHIHINSQSCSRNCGKPKLWSRTKSDQLARLNHHIIRSYTKQPTHLSYSSGGFHWLLSESPQRGQPPDPLALSSPMRKILQRFLRKCL